MLPVKNFFGEIDGTNIYDFTSKLDYKLKQADRIELLNSILYDDDGKMHPYFEEVTNSYK